MAGTTTPQAQGRQTVYCTPLKPAMTFLSLPTDVRLLIYDWVFSSTTLEADQDTTPAEAVEDAEESAQEQIVQNGFGRPEISFYRPKC